MPVVASGATHGTAQTGASRGNWAIDWPTLAGTYANAASGERDTLRGPSMPTTVVAHAALFGVDGAARSTPHPPAPASGVSSPVGWSRANAANALPKNPAT